MLDIRHKGIQANLDLDTSGFTFQDVEANADLPYIVALVAGKAVNVDSDGKVQLTGAVSGLGTALGLLVNDARGYFYENKPGIASEKAAVTIGNCVVVTDQLTAAALAEPIEPGDPIYVAMEATSDGFLTSTAGTPGTVKVGTALSGATVANPNLLLAVGV